MEIVQARLADIPGLLTLINDYASRGIMLPRNELEMAENIRDFVVARDGATLVGCGALHFYTPHSGEVRSLAVLPGETSQGVGRRIVEALDREAAAQGLYSVFAFTYVPGFFAKLGYDEVDRNELPLKAWKDCMRCPKFERCDEVAMLKRLRVEPPPVLHRVGEFAILPTLRK